MIFQFINLQNGNITALNESPHVLKLKIFQLFLIRMMLLFFSVKLHMQILINEIILFPYNYSDCSKKKVHNRWRRYIHSSLGDKY